MLYYIRNKVQIVFFITATLYEGLREPEMVMDDIFIRKFMTGTWHDLFVSEVGYFM